MTALRERIAAIVEERSFGCLRSGYEATADVILALFRDEAPPSDEELHLVFRSEESPADSNRAVYDLGHARAYAKAEAEREEKEDHGKR